MNTMRDWSYARPIRVAVVSILGLAVASLSLTGCADAGRDKPAPSTSSEGVGVGPVRGESLTIALQAPATGINPASVNTAFHTYALLSYEPIVYKGEGGEIKPALAESWEVNDDNTQIDFTIREGVTFSDGDAVTADAIKASLDYCASDASVNKLTMANVGSVTVPTENHVSVQLNSPSPSIESMFSQIAGCGMIISPAGLENIDNLTVDHDSAGAGAYVYKADESVPGDTYTYIANPSYYDMSKQHYDKVVLRVIANPQAALNGIQTGQVDVTVGDLSTAAQAKTAGLNLAWTPFIWAGLNLIDRDGETTPALSDLRVRQAINYAIDRDAITAALLGEFGVPTAQISAEGFDGHSAKLDDAYAYDPAKAKALLAEAGYGDGFVLPVMTVAFGGLDTIVMAITPMLADVGITVDATVSTDEKTYIDGMVNHQYSAAAVGYGSQPMYEMAQGLVIPTALPFNGFGTDDPDALAIVDQLARASGDAQSVLAVELNTYLTDKAWFAPVVFVPQIIYYSDAVAGMELSGKSPTLQVLDIYSAG